MRIKKEYTITKDYISFGSSRPGTSIGKTLFTVSHDTGNPGSTAYQNRAYFDKNIVSASAHTFIDDQYILEIIPLDEIAYHVRYEVPTDNKLFGEDANDAAIGVELCYGGSIDFWNAYSRYVWYHAYLCGKFGLDPLEDIVSHHKLDPTRRLDPQNVFHHYDFTMSEFLSDVKKVYDGWGDDNNRMLPINKDVKESYVLSQGDQGPLARELQQNLMKVGEKLPRYGADGIYGDETRLAVRSFQAKHGLKVDGLAGPKTLAKLHQILHSFPQAVRPYPGRYIQRGSTGGDVKAVQRAVNVKPDGIFGPVTEAAVKQYQNHHGLVVDGIVGPKTWNMMF